MHEDGFDSVKRTFDESLSLSSVKKDSTIVVERSVGEVAWVSSRQQSQVNRILETKSGLRMSIRHRTASGFAFASGTEFLKSCGLQPTIGCVFFFRKSWNCRLWCPAQSDRVRSPLRSLPWRDCQRVQHEATPGSEWQLRSCTKRWSVHCRI